MPDLNEQLRAVGVSRDAESPSGKGVLVSFNRAPTDDELRTLHDQLRQHGSAVQAVGEIRESNGVRHVAYFEGARELPVGTVFYAAPPVVAEQPAAAGNALTEALEHAEFMQHFPMPEGLRASVYDAWQHDQLRRKEGWEAAIKHLRAAPQAAQGKGLTIDTPQFRVLVSSVAWESRTAPSDAFEAALNRLIAHIDQTIAAHTTKERSERETRASDGEDAERLDWLVAERAVVHEHGTRYRLYWTEHDEYQSEFYPSPRAAIDAAMQQAASNQQEGAK